MDQNNSLIPPEILKQAEIIQDRLKNPNPHLTLNLPLLPIYLGEIYPLNPVNKVLPELNLIKILNHA